MEVEPATEAPTLATDAHQQRVGVAEALLALPEPEAELAWQQLPREALLAQISQYRESIRGVAGQLHGLGDAGLPTAEEELLLLPGCVAAVCGGPPAAAGPDDDPDDTDLQQLGDEALDYTLGNVDDVDPSEWQVPPHCVPIHANVTTFDWPSLYEHYQFDVVMMDPPWQLATANPTRGVALGYSQLSDDHISGLPVPELQRKGGFLFVWVINAKYKWTLDLFDKWGYRLVDEVVWVKMTVNRRLAKSHGYYLQHAKEVCLVAKCGNPPALAGSGGGVGSDIIFSERRGQSQKPEEIYELIEQLVPNGRYLEIFARKNNLRDYWVSIGNEVTGTGLPDEDMRALKELNCIPGAVYGKTGSGSAAAAAGGGGAAGRTASSGGGPGAVAAGGEARTSSGAGATSSAPGRARSAPPAGISGQGQNSNGGGVSAAAYSAPGLPPRPPPGGAADAQVAPAAAAAAQARQRSPNPQDSDRLPPSLPPPHINNPQQHQQEGADGRRPSKLSLVIRRHSQQQQHQQEEESTAKPAAADADITGPLTNSGSAGQYGQHGDDGTGLPSGFKGPGDDLPSPLGLTAMAATAAAAPRIDPAATMPAGGSQGRFGGGVADGGEVAAAAEGMSMAGGGVMPYLGPSGGDGGGGFGRAEAMVMGDEDGLGGGVSFGGTEDMELGFAAADDWVCGEDGT